jgi:hypothetical protein
MTEPRASAWWHRLTAAPAERPAPRVSVVVPTLGGRGLGHLLRSLDEACGDRGPEVVVVDDRPAGRQLELVGPLSPRVVRSGGRGRATARNVGLRSATGEWVVLLDDDLVVEDSWYDELLGDLARAGRTVAGVAARVGGPPEIVRVGVDVAYRRLVALSLGGFQATYPRAACHDDVELAQRIARCGWLITAGRRPCAAPSPGNGRAATGPIVEPLGAEAFAADQPG